MMMGLKQKIVIFANGILFFACLLISVLPQAIGPYRV